MRSLAIIDGEIDAIDADTRDVTSEPAPTMEVRETFAAAVDHLIGDYTVPVGTVRASGSAPSDLAHQLRNDLATPKNLLGFVLGVLRDDVVEHVVNAATADEKLRPAGLPLEKRTNRLADNTRKRRALAIEREQTACAIERETGRRVPRRPDADPMITLAVSDGSVPSNLADAAVGADGIAKCLRLGESERQATVVSQDISARHREAREELQRRQAALDAYLHAPNRPRHPAAEWDEAVAKRQAEVDSQRMKVDALAKEQATVDAACCAIGATATACRRWLKARGVDVDGDSRRVA